MMQVYICSCSVCFGIGQPQGSFINNSRILLDSRNLQMIRKDWKSEMFYEVSTTAKWLIPQSHDAVLHL